MAQNSPQLAELDFAESPRPMRITAAPLRGLEGLGADPVNSAGGGGVRQQRAAVQIACREF